MKRNIAVSIILTIITCGIYGLYWMVVLNDELIEKTKEQGTSGIVCLLLTFVTCGIYGIYWAYVVGQRVDKINGSNSSTGLVYLLLSIFGLSIVAIALAQNELNNA